MLPEEGATMRPILKATALLAGSSGISVVAAVGSAKAWALIVGPEGLGTFGLLQAMVALGSMVTAAGLNSGLVRFGAAAHARGDTARLAAVRLAAFRCTLALGVAAAVLLAIFARPLSSVMVGASGHATDVVLMGPAVLLTLLAGVQMAVLNAHHMVPALARVNAAGSVSGAAIGVLLVWSFGRDAIPWAVLTLPAVNAAYASWLVHRKIGPVVPPGPQRLRDAASELFSFGLPYTASMLAGSGVQLAIPALIVHALGTEEVGYFRAATTVAVAYVGFLLAAMAQDYYPRVAARAQDNHGLNHLINQQVRLVTVVGVPVILLALVATPVLVPLLYTAEFAPAITVLRWLWAGTAFKLWSWTLSFVVLARCSGRQFFAIEAVGGATMLAATLPAMALFGLPGVGLAFLLATAVYCAFVWVVVRRETALSLTSANRRLLAGAVGVLAAVQVLTSLRNGFGDAATIVLVSISVTTAAILLWRDISGVHAPLSAE
jgi:enterobacterial common antigen flippase